MIAPLRQTEPPAESSSLRAARRLVARTLLTEPSPRCDAAPVAAWRAWSFVAWIATVIAACAAHLLGWI